MLVLKGTEFWWRSVWTMQFTWVRNMMSVDILDKSRLATEMLTVVTDFDRIFSWQNVPVWWEYSHTNSHMMQLLFIEANFMKSLHVNLAWMYLRCVGLKFTYWFCVGRVGLCVMSGIAVGVLDMVGVEWLPSYLIFFQKCMYGIHDMILLVSYQYISSMRHHWFRFMTYSPWFHSVVVSSSTCVYFRKIFHTHVHKCVITKFHHQYYPHIVQLNSFWNPFLLGSISLQWRHNKRHGVSNYQHLDRLLSRLFRRTLKKTSKLRVTAVCEGNPTDSPHKGTVTRKMRPFDDAIVSQGKYIVSDSYGFRDGIYRNHGHTLYLCFCVLIKGLLDVSYVLM